MVTNPLPPYTSRDLLVFSRGRGVLSPLVFVCVVVPNAVPGGAVVELVLVVVGSAAASGARLAPAAAATTTETAHFPLEHFVIVVKAVV